MWLKRTYVRGAACCALGDLPGVPVVGTSLILVCNDGNHPSVNNQHAQNPREAGETGSEGGRGQAAWQLGAHHMVPGECLLRHRCLQALAVVAQLPRDTCLSPVAQGSVLARRSSALRVTVSSSGSVGSACLFTSEAGHGRNKRCPGDSMGTKQSFLPSCASPALNAHGDQGQRLWPAWPCVSLPVGLQVCGAPVPWLPGLSFGARHPLSCSGHGAQG